MTGRSAGKTARIASNTSSGKRIRFSIRGGDFRLPAQQATSCALIVNELLQNTVKHAFRGRQEGEVVVDLGYDDAEMRIEILDDGRVTDGQGRTVDFTNTVLILTSNIGSASILDLAGDPARHSEMESRVNEALRAHFRPEFLNRLDETIIFHPLGREELHQIVDLAEVFGVSVGRIMGQAIEPPQTSGAQYREEIATLKHPLAKDDKLASASMELSAVVKATEEATGAIMQVAEHLDELAREFLLESLRTFGQGLVHGFLDAGEVAALDQLAADVDRWAQQLKAATSLFQRRNGIVDLSFIRGPGFGYRADEVRRSLS
mgnify:CR=1 FL=1